MINVKADLRAALKVCRDLPKTMIPKIAAASLNKAARSVRTIAKREAANALGVKSNKIMKRFRIAYALPKPRRLTSSVSVTKDRPIPVHHFRRFKQNSAGVEFRVGGRLYQVKGAFIQRGVALKRDSKRGRRVGRYPIRKAFGPRLWFGFMNPKVQQLMRTKGRQIFNSEFRRLAKLRGSFRG